MNAYSCSSVVLPYDDNLHFKFDQTSTVNMLIRWCKILDFSVALKMHFRDMWESVLWCTAESFKTIY